MQDPTWDKFVSYVVRLFEPLVMVKKKRTEEEMDAKKMNQAYGPWLKLVMWDDGKLHMCDAWSVD